MSTLTNKTNRHIAELMLIGTFMGVITCEKDKYDHKNISPEIDEILRKLRMLEEDNIDNLIPFLA